MSLKPGRVYRVWWPDIIHGIKRRWAICCLKTGHKEWLFLGGTGDEGRGAEVVHEMSLQSDGPTTFYDDYGEFIMEAQVIRPHVDVHPDDWTDKIRPWIDWKLL